MSRGNSVGRPSLAEPTEHLPPPVPEENREKKRGDEERGENQVKRLGPIVEAEESMDCADALD